MVAAAALVLSAAGSANPSVKIVELGQFQGVRIQGTVQGVVGNGFILREGTGQVIVDGGPGWYHQHPLRRTADGHPLMLYQIIRANGEVMTIRFPGQVVAVTGNNPGSRC